MSTTAVERTAPYQAIDRLPDEALGDLASIVERLVLQHQGEEEKPLIKASFSPAGISKGADVSPKAIRETRRATWQAR